MRLFATTSILLAWVSLCGAQTQQASVHSMPERMILGADSVVLGPRLRAAVKAQVLEQLRDPASLQQFAISRVNARMIGDTIAPGYACGVYNAKNGYGGYAGRSYFVVRLVGRSNDPSTAYADVTVSREDNADYREACFFFPAEAAPWVGNPASKEVLRNGCLASRRVSAEQRRTFWILADALKEGFVRSKAPGC